MRNPFVAMALAAVAASTMFRSRVLSGEITVDARPSSYAKKSGSTNAAVKRAARKARNQARHRAACRG